MSTTLRVRIEGHDLPGRACQPGPGLSHKSIHVAVQGKRNPSELLGLLPGDAPAATWTLDCTVTPVDNGTDVKGPYVQGPPGGRFIYLSWGAVDGAGAFNMFRRAKSGSKRSRLMCCARQSSRACWWVGSG
jgi:hypothetical protein